MKLFNSKIFNNFVFNIFDFFEVEVITPRKSHSSFVNPKKRLTTVITFKIKKQNGDTITKSYNIVYSLPIRLFFRFLDVLLIPVKINAKEKQNVRITIKRNK